jgi:hypothetical protein
MTTKHETTKHEAPKHETAKHEAAKHDINKPAPDAARTTTHHTITIHATEPTDVSAGHPADFHAQQIEGVAERFVAELKAAGHQVSHTVTHGEPPQHDPHHQG